MGDIVENEEDDVANERDTNRMAGELLNALRESLSKPAPGTGTARPQPQLDERSMLDTITGFLNQSLPGTKEREKPGTPTTASSTQFTSQPSAPTAGNLQVDWTAMYRRQEREREDMYGRQVSERQNMHERHRKEMEALAGIRPDLEATHVRPTPGPYQQQVQKPVTPPRAPTGIVPGTSIGEWVVETENGPKTFMAVSEEQASREARRYGLTPASARLARVRTYTAEEKQQMLNSFGVPGQRESMEGEFEQAIKLGLIPENAQFERLPNREWGYRIGRRPTVYKGSDLTPKKSF